MKAVLIATLLVAGALAVPHASEAASTVRLAVFGDDGTTTSTQANVNGAVNDGAQGYVGLGDYYYWSAPSTWKSMFQPLTSKGAHLALGNHDDHAAISDVMGPATTWSKTINGARFVAINTEQRMDVGSTQYTWARGQLCNAPEGVRVLVMHRGWWLQTGARHPGTEFPGSASAMDQLVKDCGVDLVLAGHEHNYQRMVRNGVSYAIVGTGGQSLYAVAGSPSGTVSTYGGYGRLLLDISAEGYSASFKSLDGATRDSFTVTATTTTTPPPPPPSGTADVTFSPRGGNEWWVQVRVGGTDAANVRLVDSKDTNGAWVVLPKRSWGDYAASYHVEPGNLVTYRATLYDGRIVESCPMTHPAGVPVCSTTTPPPPPPPTTGTFDATFRNVRGNAWWVEADVTATGGTLAGVDARVNAGNWIALSKTSWGSYAKSIAAPTGSKVELRARAVDGASETSAAYAWPPG